MIIVLIFIAITMFHCDRGPNSVELSAGQTELDFSEKVPLSKFDISLPKDFEVSSFIENKTHFYGMELAVLPILRPEVTCTDKIGSGVKIKSRDGNRSYCEKLEDSAKPFADENYLELSKGKGKEVLSITVMAPMLQIAPEPNDALILEEDLEIDGEDLAEQPEEQVEPQPTLMIEKDLVLDKNLVCGPNKLMIFGVETKLFDKKAFDLPLLNQENAAAVFCSRITISKDDVRTFRFLAVSQDLLFKGDKEPHKVEIVYGTSVSDRREWFVLVKDLQKILVESVSPRKL